MFALATVATVEMVSVIDEPNIFPVGLVDVGATAPNVVLVEVDALIDDCAYLPYRHYPRYSFLDLSVKKSRLWSRRIPRPRRLLRSIHPLPSILYGLSLSFRSLVGVPVLLNGLGGNSIGYLAA